jgi:8-oxo-dGTP diphosphatase
VNYPTHIVAACGLITNEVGEVLLMRHRQRGWEVPGGQVEVGEDLIAGLQREIEEETGITVTVGKLTGVYSNLQSNENTPTKVIFAFLGEKSAGEPRTSPESPEVRWVLREKVLDMVTHPVLHDRIKDMLEFTGQVIYRTYTSPPYHLEKKTFLG